MSITEEEQKSCFKSIGFPPAREAVTVESSDEDDNEQLLYIEEFAESYLGTDRFNQLESAFGNIPGVNSVIHEDRELFLIESELSDEDLDDSAWKVFLSYSEEVRNNFIKDKL